jgi:hypothetical protein
MQQGLFRASGMVTHHHRTVQSFKQGLVRLLIAEQMGNFS